MMFLYVGSYFNFYQISKYQYPTNSCHDTNSYKLIHYARMSFKRDPRRLADIRQILNVSCVRHNPISNYIWKRHSAMIVLISDIYIDTNLLVL